ncbi:MAG: hypothetical protein LBU89_14765 [Fibromonadaceae bacterium]|jgi:hypothetical protein|nr:hypothetical protein [Fibromonadaceae bacterium]
MKRILLFAFFSLLIASCSSVVRTNTLASIEMETKVEALPVTADLAVSEQKTRGEAHGKVSSAERLRREALAMALGQVPASAERPDVLVGVNYFAEIEGTDLKIMLTGYPAYYTNFRTATEKDSLRLGAISTKPAGSRVYVEQPKKKESRKFDWYSSFRLHIDDTFGLGAEVGMAWQSGFFIGLEVVEGFINSKLWTESKNEYGFKFEGCFGLGGGLNLGNRFEMPNQSQMDVGLSLGFWEADYKYYLDDYSDYYLDKYYFGGPFVRARWDIFEVGYKVLLGFVDEYEKSSGFDAKHLFMVGVTF